MRYYSYLCKEIKKELITITLATISALDITVKSINMYNIYFDDGVNEPSLIKQADSIGIAVEYAKTFASEHTLVDDDHPCSDDVLNSSKVASIEVYDGEIITMVEGEAKLAEPLYTTPYFYVE